MAGLVTIQQKKDPAEGGVTVEKMEGSCGKIVDVRRRNENVRNYLKDDR
jgi:hypothetical protein